MGNLVCEEALRTTMKQDKCKLTATTSKCLSLSPKPVIVASLIYMRSTRVGRHSFASLLALSVFSPLLAWL